MNISEIKSLRAIIREAHAADPKEPMSNHTPHLDAAIAAMGEAQFTILMACEDAIKQADLEHDQDGFLLEKALTPIQVRARACRVCSGQPFWLIHHMAEAIFSASGMSDAKAWDAGRIGIHIELESYDAGEFGQQIITLAQ